MGPEKLGPLGPNKNWRSRRKRDTVLRLLQGKPLDAMSGEPVVEICRLEVWSNQALAGMERSLEKRDIDPFMEELKAEKEHIGELTMKVEVLRRRWRCDAL